uniref:Dolichyldiphosphatase 1 n=1 Tax=Plectus sambesii TaxID=2011161 RepID=A0A914WKB0_9BILA
MERIVEKAATDGDILWKPFSLTYVTYIEGDLFGKVLAVASLAPLAIFVSYGTLVVFRRDLCTIFALIGQLLNEVINYALKHTIKDPRPNILGLPHIHYGKYGFPSNHSQFICFFAAFSSLLLLFRLKQNGSQSMKLLRRFYALCCWLLAFIICFGRVYLGQHTTHQVIGGCMIGAAFGSFWFIFLHYGLTPFFPLIASWSICEWLLVRDTTLIPNILFFEYMSARSEGRARSRKHSLKPKSG